MSDKPLCLVTAPVATRSGYGSHSRDICRSLIKLDRFDVKIWPVRWGNTPMNALDPNDENDKPIVDRLLDAPDLPKQPEVHIHIVIPNEFSTVGKYNIGITAGVETTVCPSDWIQGMNRMDLNIVPSNFVKEVMLSTKFDSLNDQTQEKIGELSVEKPIEVLFEGVDSTIFKKTKEFSKELVDEFEKIEEKFCFLYVGHWLQGGLGVDRKDTGMLIKVFLETFKNKPVKPALVMKTSGATLSVLDREDILEKIQHIKNSVKGDLPSIYLLHGDFTDIEMNELYNHPKVKAHVTLTHGEGFGRPLLEATISEKPVIAPGWSGHCDFLHPDQAILLGGSMSRVEKDSFQENIWVDGAEWFTANYMEASNTIKDVYVNYKKYTLSAKKLGIVNKGKFSLDTMTKKFGKILDDNVPEFPKEVELNLPKLKKTNENKAPKIKLPKLKRA
jgi:hypothetical protein